MKAQKMTSSGSPRPAVGKEGLKQPIPTRHFDTQEDRDAVLVEEFVFPAALSGLVGKSIASPLGMKKYVDKLVKSAARTEDPIERLMIEHILLAHHRLLQLHQAASTQDSHEGVAVYNAVVVRLTSELRRLVLALRQYREPVASKSVAFIQQQNVAHTQDVEFNQGGEKNKEIVSDQIELGGTEHEPAIGGRCADLLKEPSTCGGGPDQRVPATALDN